MTVRPIVAIVWAPPGYGARSHAFSKWLNAREYYIHYLKFRRPIYAPVKYIFQWIKTWLVLVRERPDFIYVTNSPPMAGLCVCVYCMFTHSQYVLDTHPPVLFTRKWRWSRPLVRFVARRAVVNVIDQERFGLLFESWGARVVILQDPPETIATNVNASDGNSNSLEISYVGTFSGDEPVDIVIETARQVPDVTFYLLGKKSRAKQQWLESAPDNAIFTDYLLGDDYWKHLMRSRAIIVLTTHRYSLLGAAQDGLYIDKPLILSDQPVLREYFTKGVVFVPNTAQGIIKGLKNLLEDEERYKREIAELHRERALQWETNFRQLLEIVKVRDNWR